MAPQGGIYMSWGGIQSIWGIGEEWTPWGGMDPFGGNQQITINSPGCSSGWRILWRLDQCLFMLHYDLRAVAHYHRTHWVISQSDVC